MRSFLRCSGYINFIKDHTQCAFIANSSLLCFAMLCVLSSFASVLKRKRELFAKICFSFWCLVIVSVMWFFLTVLWVGLQCVIMVLPEHTRLLFTCTTTELPLF